MNFWEQAQDIITQQSEPTIELPNVESLALLSTSAGALAEVCARDGKPLDPGMLQDLQKFWMEANRITDQAFGQTAEQKQ